MQDAGASPRARLYVLGVLAAGLALAGLVVILTGGGERSAASAADQRCLEAWNDDRTAVALGRHQFNGHGYERVQVLRVSDSGAPSEDPDGLCAVVFAATELDPEPGARGQVLLDGRWSGLEALPEIGERAIGRLQSEAVAGTNARLGTDGRLAARAD